MATEIARFTARPGEEEHPREGLLRAMAIFPP
jgi:hypothetical protein